MKKLILTLALLLAPLSTYAGVKSEMLEPVVKINNNCSASSISIPEGKRLLTAAHCVNGMKLGTFFEEVRNDKEELVTVTHYYFDVIRTDPKNDLALLKLRDTGKEIPIAKIADKILVEEGEQVWTVGYPLAFARTITEGLLNQSLNMAEITGDYKTMLRASPGIDGGNSGGALFQKNGVNYELIGVTSMKANSNDFMGIYVPLKNIREFLRLDIGKTNSYQIDKR